MAQVVQSKGIYHGLPVYPPEVRGLTAIITGANGISGKYVLQALSEAPERWSKIYCLSRGPAAWIGALPPTVEHISVDFTHDPKDIAKILKLYNVNADHIFWYSYVHLAIKPGDPFWCDSEELSTVNKQIFKSFLEALVLASVRPKRILVQTGGKNYGLHCGPVKQPAEEWHPRYTRETNFYYAQEDLLWDYCKKYGVGWNITCPAGVFGAAPILAMNPAFALGVYASVCRHLKRPLLFPGGIEAWQACIAHINARLNGYFCEWVVLTEGAKNQKFNIHDNSPFTCETLWPKLAGWYGLEYGGPEEQGLTEIEYGHDPPPRGYGPKAVIRYKFTFDEWLTDPTVQEAWRELSTKHDLVYKDLVALKPALTFGNATVHQPGPFIMSMDKSRRLGWHGHVDTCEGLLEVLDEFARLRMIPEVPKVKVEFI